MTETPTWDFIDAAYALLLADASMTALVGDRYYKSVASRSGEQRVRPYIVFADTTEQNQHQFAKLGSAVTQYIHIAVGNNPQQVHTIYDHIKRLLRRPIALNDHVMLRIDVALEATFQDENYEGERGIVRCAVTTVKS